jgi:biopolymer transport protein ExbD
MLSVIVPKEGPTLVNGVTVAGDEALMVAARAVHDTDPSARAVISADGDVPHRTMLHVLDLLKQSGFSGIAFAARPLESTP